MDDKSHAPEMSEDENPRNLAEREAAISESFSRLMQSQPDPSSAVNQSSKQPVEEISLEERRKQQEGKPARLSQYATQASGSGAADPPSGEYAEPRYYGNLLSILGERNDISVMLDAYKNFDKQCLTFIHNKAAMYLTHPQVGERLRMHTNPEQEIEGTPQATEAADELVPVSLKDLEIGKRNECVVLYGELCVDPFKFGRMYTLLEEAETGNAVSLSIVSPNPSYIHQSFATRNYPRGSKIAVKEPMLVRGEGGLIFINVDNPSSIETVQRLPASADVNVTVGRDKLDKWMICANKAFAVHDWEKCMRNYTKCEVCKCKGMSKERSFVLRMYRERWVAYVLLGRYQDALQDAEKYGELDPTQYLVALYKIRSLLSLGRYKDAFHFLERSCDRFPKSGESLRATYRKWSGVYFDISKAIIEPAARTPNVYKPDGDFVGPVEIRMTGSKNGRGLFATENISAGQVLLISKGLVVSQNRKKDQSALLQIVKDALTSCGEKSRQIFLSHRMEDLSRFIPKISDFITETAGDYNVPTSNKQKDWATISENYEQLSESEKDNEILRILQRIAFDDSSPAAMQENCKKEVIFNDVPDRLYYGVWLLPSFINHTCMPNAARINVGDILRIHAAADIRAGGEITIPYFNVLVPYPSRQMSCKPFGFSCVCRRCQLESLAMKLDDKITKDLYKAYQRIGKSKIEIRATQLQNLVTHVENCLKHLRQKIFVRWRIEEILVFEGFIRASFTPAYLAFIAHRKRTVRKKAVMEENDKLENISLYDAASGILITCPGSLQFLIFWQGCQSLWRDRAKKYEHWRLQKHRTEYEVHVIYAKEAMEAALPAVYGHFVEATRKQIIEML